MNKEEFVREIMERDPNCYTELAEAHYALAISAEAVLKMAGSGETIKSLRSLMLAAVAESLSDGEQGIVKQFTKEGHEVTASWHAISIMREMFMLSRHDRKIARSVLASATLAMKLDDMVENLGRGPN